MKIARIAKHLFYSRRKAKRLFPPAVLTEIEQAVKASEGAHSAELRFVIEAALSPVLLRNNLTAKQRALEIFAEFGVWDTEQNNGVLIYLLLADHAIEIVADRGINRIIGASGWEAICREMQEHFRRARYREGALAGIARISAILKEHFPREGADQNELPNHPVIL